MKNEATAQLVRTITGWVSIVAIVVTVFLPPKVMQYGAAVTWLLLGCWMFFYAWYGYLVKEIGVHIVADDYVGHRAQVVAVILMVFAIIVFVLPSFSWLILQLVRGD